MPLYVALIDGKPGAYGVVVPDLPGCTSAAATADQALRNAVEAVRLWVDQAKADGIAVPAAPSIEALRRDPEVIEALAEGAAPAMVPLIREAGRPRRVNMKM